MASDNPADYSGKRYSPLKANYPTVSLHIDMEKLEAIRSAIQGANAAVANFGQTLTSTIPKLTETAALIKATPEELKEEFLQIVYQCEKESQQTFVMAESLALSHYSQIELNQLGSIKHVGMRRSSVNIMMTLPVMMELLRYFAMLCRVREDFETNRGRYTDFGSYFISRLFNTSDVTISSIRNLGAPSDTTVQRDALIERASTIAQVLQRDDLVTNLSANIVPPPKTVTWDELMDQASNQP